MVLNSFIGNLYEKRNIFTSQNCQPALLCETTWILGPTKLNSTGVDIFGAYKNVNIFPSQIGTARKVGNIANFIYYVLC
jgi:hypothetical protein